MSSNRILNLVHRLLGTDRSRFSRFHTLFGVRQLNFSSSVSRLCSGQFPLRFWKIDLYDRDYQWYSPAPTDPAKTNRVLTILLAEEY